MPYFRIALLPTSLLMALTCGLTEWSRDVVLSNNLGLIIILWLASLIACVTIDGRRGNWAFLGILIVIWPYWLMIGACLISSNCL